MKLLKILTLYTLVALNVGAQIDREFWFALPDISDGTIVDFDPDNGSPIKLHFTSIYATTVVLSKPADLSFTPLVYKLNDNEHVEIDLSNILTPDQWETIANNNLSDVKEKGFLIESYPSRITAYFEWDNGDNKEIMTLKGKNALGTDFWVTTQNQFSNDTALSKPTRSGFAIVASEDNTTVWVERTLPFLYFSGPTPQTLKIEFKKKGETFAFEAASNSSPHINGIHVTSDKDIAITSYDDGLVFNNRDGIDMVADQIVPVSLVGTQYFLKKGFLNTKEYLMITSTANTNVIRVNGAVAFPVMNAGEVQKIEFTEDSILVESDFPICVNHISGIRYELAMANIPPINDCHGAHNVPFTRGANPLDVMHFRIYAKNDPNNLTAKNFHIINGIDTTIIPSSYFGYQVDRFGDSIVYLLDNTAIQAYISLAIPVSNSIRLYNPISRFQFGVLSGNKAHGAKYGFYSDYSIPDPSAGIGGSLYSQDTTTCNLNPIRLVASGGESYIWKDIGQPGITDFLNDDSIASPIFDPDTSGVYNFRVEIRGRCITGVWTEDITSKNYFMPASDFTFDQPSICSDDSLLLENISNMTYTARSTWTVSPTNQTINSNTIPNPFYLKFPPNLTDSIIIYTISLNSYSPGDYCVNSRNKDFVVRPEIKASFISSDTIGCAPLTINFDNKTTTGSDTAYFKWNFDNGTQSTDSLPTNTFTNLSSNTRVYDVELVASTKEGCYDTANLNITIHPLVDAKVALDSNLSCSPIVATFDPSASKNADSLFWTIDYFYGDSVYFTDKNDPIKIIHYDNTMLSGPDTLFINLWVKNAQGCVDSIASPKKLIVYPDIIADFTIDKDSICDGDSITFTNLSAGYKPRFEWVFGNSSYEQDSSGISYTKQYFNRTNFDSVYTIQLKAISGFCSSIKDTTIVTSPYVDANFGFEFINNCSPLTATITNTSINVDSLVWNMGDGNIRYDSDPAFTHLYINTNLNNDTTYTIKLWTSNSQGCADSTTNTLTVLPEVIASFNISDSLVCSGSTIDFTNSSTGGDLTYNWEFGDNQTGSQTASSFSKIYDNHTDTDVTYQAVLTAINGVGCFDKDTHNVNVLAQINSFFDLPRIDSCSPFTIQPENLSTNSANVYHWLIDGVPYTSEDAVDSTFINTSNAVDTIVIQLTVAGANDSAHWSCTDTVQKKILVYPELFADFDLTDSVSCQPLKTSITNLSHPSLGTSFEWYIDDDYYSNLKNPSDLNISNPSDVDSVHNLYLYGISKYGCRDTASHEFTVYAYIDALFTLDKLGMCDYDSVSVDRSSSSGDIASVNWFFDNVLFNYPQEKFKHSFDAHSSSIPENRVVELKLENSQGCRDSISRQMQLYPKVLAGFEMDSNTVCFPHTTVFTDTSRYAHHWSWDFGNDLSSTEQNPSHVYQNHSRVDDSLYTVQLIARSDYNCYDTTSQQITIWAEPKAYFYFPVTIDCPPFDVQMINESEGSNLTHYWTYSNTNSTDKNVNFTFNNFTDKIEEQAINLLITSDKGCKDSLTETIRVYPNLTADISTTDDTVGCSPLNVNFNISDQTNIQQVLWYMDGEPFSSIVSTSYRFTNPSDSNETHTIKVIARSLNNCVDTSEIPVTVYPTPSGVFTASPIPAKYDTIADQTIINFTNSTPLQSNWSYEWNFGDNSSNQINEAGTTFQHIYGDRFWGKSEDDFRIPVTLVSWNKDNPECRDTTLPNNIIIEAPFPQISIFEDLSGCQPFTVDFSSQTKYARDSSFYWEFGDGVSSSKDKTPSFTFEEPGVYSVRLTVEGDRGRVSDYKIITVYAQPTIDFAFNDTVVAVTIDTINFNNYTVGSVENYWYFDSNEIFSGNYNSSDKDASWAYSEPGVYYPALISSTTENCYDTLISPSPIKVYEIGRLEFPNIFDVNPNQLSEEYASNQAEGTGNRNLFYPKHVSIFSYHLEIYSRWGIKVFESTDVSKGWNGIIEGTNKPAQQGVYVWRARGRFTNGLAYDFSGDVTLLHKNTNN